MWGMGTYHVETVSRLADDSTLAKQGNVTNTDPEVWLGAFGYGEHSVLSGEEASGEAFWK